MGCCNGPRDKPSKIIGAAKLARSVVAPTLDRVLGSKRLEACADCPSLRARRSGPAVHFHCSECDCVVGQSRPRSGTVQITCTIEQRPEKEYRVSPMGKALLADERCPRDRWATPPGQE